MWSNISGKGGFRCDSLLYSKIFEILKEIMQTIKRRDSITRSWEIGKVGTILFFPSWIRHGTFLVDYDDDEYRMFYITL